MGIERVEHELLPKQYEFIQACNHIPFTAYIGGFGSGKTHVLNLLIMHWCRQKCFSLIGAPSYRLLADTTQRKFFELCPPQWIRNFAKSENKVTLTNGTELIFRSLDAPERLTNLSLDWAALDEIGEVKVDTFRMLQGRLRNKDGYHRIACVGNPAGPTHWSYDYFVLKAREYPDHYRLIQAPSYENTFVPSSYVEEMERSYGLGSLYYRRFVMGEFVAFEGAYWPNFNIEPYTGPIADENGNTGGHVLKRSQIKDILNNDKNWQFGKVVDFGFEHPFVCMWFITDGAKIVFYDEHHEQHAPSIRHHCTVIKAKETEHKRNHGWPAPEWAYTDHEATIRSEIEHCIDEQNKPIGFRCVIANKEVMPGILLVQTLIENDALYITEECLQARLELPSYRAKSNITREEPLKEKDDTCDCVRMACMGVLGHLSPFVRFKSKYSNVDSGELYGNQPEEIEQHGSTQELVIPRAGTSVVEDKDIWNA